MKNIISIFLLLLSYFSFGQNQNLKKEISQVIDGKKATVAVSVLNLENGKSLDINGNKMLPLLSVFKFHIAIAVLQKVDEGKLNLDQNIFVTKKDLHENTYSPFRKEYPEGNVTKKLSELLGYMISQSDNNITDVLIKLAGGTDEIQKILNEKGAKNFIIQADEAKMHEGWEYLYLNKSTTNSLTDLLNQFFKGKMLSESSTNFLMTKMLETSTGTNKLIAGLPKGTTAPHRTGSSGKNEEGLTAAENDIGIVTLKNGKKYAISVLVSDSMESEETNTKMIAAISKLVFDHFSKN